MTEYEPKEFNDTTQYPETYTETVDNLGTARGRIKVVTTAAGATATHGALDVLYDKIVFITGAASTATLAAGIDGQELTLAMDTDGGDMVVTCAVLLGGNTITFDNTDTISLTYDAVNANWFPEGTPTAAISTV